MSYHVRLADVRAARDQLLPLWAQNLPIHGALDDKLRWFYCDGPHGRGQAFVLESEDPAAAVGCAGVGVRTLAYRDRRLRAALFADLAIDRAHRSGFPALALVRAVKAHATEAYDLGYGFPNAKAAPVYRRAGYVELGAMARYVRVLRTAPYVARHVRWPRLARAIGRVVDGGLAVVTRLRNWPAPALALEWLDDADARFDRLWDEARLPAPILCERTAEFLRWRFLRQPAQPYRIAALTERASGRLRAYAVIRHEHAAAEIADLFGADPSALDALLAHLIPALYRAGCGTVTIRFLGTATIPSLLALHGFTRRPDTRAIALALPAGAPAELRDPNAWYLTDLDEDT